jgi:hypothetical protein
LDHVTLGLQVQLAGQAGLLPPGLILVQITTGVKVGVLLKGLVCCLLFTVCCLLFAVSSA